MTLIVHAKTEPHAAPATAPEASRGLRVTRMLTAILLLSVFAALTARCGGGPNRNNGGQYSDHGIK